MVFGFDLLDPTDTSIAAQFPANERVFRTTVQNYLGVEHDGTQAAPQGFHKFQIGTNALRNSLSTPPTGMLWYSSTDVQLEINTGTPATPTWVPTGAVPAGTVLTYAGATAPSGYLLCNGAAVSRTTFAVLFGVIGSTYGAGDGSTTFNVPDLRGRVAVGQDPNGTTGRLTGSAAGSIPGGAATLGSAGGQEGHTQSVNELPVHAHPSPAVTDPGHAHSPGGGATGFVTSAGTVVDNTGTGSNGASHQSSTATATTGITLAANSGNTGGGAAFNVVQPSIVLNKIIKT